MTRQRAIEAIKADPAFKKVPIPGTDQTEFKVTLPYSEEIGSGFIGRPGTENKILPPSGKKIKVWTATDPTSVKKATTTIKWDPAAHEWKVVQHYPDARP